MNTRLDKKSQCFLFTKMVCAAPSFCVSSVLTIKMNHTCGCGINGGEHKNIAIGYQDLVPLNEIVIGTYTLEVDSNMNNVYHVPTRSSPSPEGQFNTRLDK